MVWLGVPREKACALVVSLAVEDFHPDWIRLAVLEATRRGKRDWGFLLGILRNWKREGG